MTRTTQTNDGVRRGGFTLIEMLVVITIVVILAAITVAAVYATANSDRIRGAARQMQSAMQGGLAKATRARKPIGVRLLLNENDPSTVDRMIFIEQLDDYQVGEIRFRKQNMGDPSFRYIEIDPGTSPNFQDLKDRGQLPDVTRIKLTDTAGVEHILVVNTMQTGTLDPRDGTMAENPNWLVLITPVNFGDIDIIMPDPGGNTALSDWIPDNADGTANYRLEMGNNELSVDESQQSLELPNGNLIDLDYSYLPTEWFQEQEVAAPFLTTDPLYAEGWRETSLPPSGGGNVVIRRYGEYIKSTNHMDILFSPEGVVAGPLQAVGKIHFLLAEVDDMVSNTAPHLAEGENMITSVFTHTGNVAAYPVDRAALSTIYDFAETGEVAGR